MAATRSLIQPLVPGLGDLEPVVLREGTEIELEHVTERLVDLAYARVEMVEKRGEFAVRGGIVDLFPPTAESPVRIEFWGDEVSDCVASPWPTSDRCRTRRTPARPRSSPRRAASCC